MRTIISFLLLLLSLAASSQQIRVRSVKKVRPADEGFYLLTGVVPGTHYLLVTGEGYKGLWMLDYRRGSVRKITADAGAGFEPAVTDDGSRVIYRSDIFSENRKYSSIRSFNTQTGETATLIEKERGVLPPAIAGNTLFIKSDNVSRVEATGSVALKGGGGDLFVVVEDLVPVIYSGGVRKPLKPSGEGYYIWVSLSPDRTKILYNYQGQKTCICDLEGRVLCEAGRIDAPRWLNDRIVIGMDDRDDGYRVIASEIVYFSLADRKIHYLTDTKARSEMYPISFDGGRKLTFCTDRGEIYIMKIRIR
jgi:Tol biopolymer transport system component